MSQRRIKRKLDRNKDDTYAAKGYYNLKSFQRALNIAVEMKKYTKGHLFSKTLKDRCVFCGKTPKTTTECPYWVLTLFDRIQTVLVNPTFFRDDELQALWLQHGDEYQNIRLPINITPPGKPKARKDRDESTKN